MLNILINKQITGFSHHILLNDGKIKWSDDLSEGHLKFGFENHESSIEPLLKLFEIALPDLIPQEYIKAMQVCGENQVPWAHVIPSKKFKKLTEKFINSLHESLCFLDNEQYTQFYIITNKLFSKFSPAKISSELSQNLLDSEESQGLKSIIQMSKDGMLEVPFYDRVSTKTGRLIVKSGPSILTLKKEYRSIFVPSSPDRVICEIDFTSLEPRIAANIANRKVTKDVYASFIEQRKINVSREVAKLSILCALYGAGKAKLQEVLQQENNVISANKLIAEVKDFFELDKLTAYLKKQSSSGLKNYFGRPLQVSDSRDALLINSFLQSTAADLAIMGFLDFCEVFQKRIKPLFIIHDALIFETAKDHLEEISQYADKGFVIDEVGNFPLKLKELSTYG